ncbi:hypothetical protein F2Q70_00036213 [Brassica cretica]|nr:hypothetical protein F2Q70_00036213 [Brassica cretica]
MKGDEKWKSHLATNPAQEKAQTDLGRVLLRYGPRSNLEENKFSRDRPRSSRRFQVLDMLRDDLARLKTLVAFHWMSRLIHGACGLKSFSLVCPRPDGKTFDASVGINISFSVAGPLGLA